MAEEANKVIYSMQGVSKTVERKQVLRDINLAYYYGAKIGVLGLNGAGKSSLMRILAREDTEHEGETHLSPGHTIGFLHQEPQLDDSKTVREIVEEGVSVVGGCCGTTTEHIRQLANACDGLSPAEREVTA